LEAALLPNASREKFDVVADRATEFRHHPTSSPNRACLARVSSHLPLRLSNDPEEDGRITGIEWSTAG
jgi:hypothetical protein